LATILLKEEVFVVYAYPEEAIAGAKVQECNQLHKKSKKDDH
jgi:hypothetical protein